MFLHHFTAVLDDWDPRVIDPIARAAPRHHLRQPRDRRFRRQGAAHDRRDGRRRRRVHPGARPRPGRPARLLPRRRCRAGGHPAEPGAGPAADPHRHRASRRRRPDQDAADRRRRLHQGCADAPRPEAVPVLQPRRGRQAGRDRVHRALGGAHGRSRQAHLPSGADRATPGDPRKPVSASRTTSRRSRSRRSWPTATTTSWSPPASPALWPSGSPTASS